MSAFFHDANPTPEFPDRPDHPDFRLIAEIVQDIDAQAELGVDIATLTEADLPSVVYLADNRLFILSGKTGWYQSMSPTLRLKLIGFYLDAFTIGVSFGKRRTSGTETGTAGEGSSS